MKSATKSIESAVVYTLTATCVWGAYLETECVRVLEMRDAQTLLDLHYAIQEAVQFDADHLHEFYAARTERSRPRFSLTAQRLSLMVSTLQLSAASGLFIRN